MRNEACSWSRWWRAAVLAAAMLVVSGSSRAADMYRIQGVPVDVTAESGVAAREQALVAGERLGLTRLMQRLTAPTAHGRLPDVASLPIERYVNSFEIAQEKVGPNRYIGVLNVSYVAAEVQSLLNSTGIPHVQRRSDPILVVPVDLSGGEPKAWDETSPWRTAWYDGIEQATVTVLALPLGDLADIAAAPPGALMAGDQMALDALTGRYGSETVVVAAARIDRAPDGGKPTQIQLTARRAGAWDQPILATVVAVPADEDEPTALGHAVGQVVAAIEDDWKRRTAGHVEPVTELAVAVPLADLPGWVQIRRELTGLPEVRSLGVDSFAQSEARVTIGYQGDLERLVAAVGRVGLSLAEESDGWRLRPAGGLADFPAPAAVSPATP
jgi:hypothetical protein